MHILMLEWDSFAQEYVQEEFKKADCIIDVMQWPFGIEEMRENDELYSDLVRQLRGTKYNFVFSFNFFPVAAKACNEMNIRYVSWIYDTPYLLLYSKYTKLETNYIYFFDKSLYREFKASGIKHAYYLPLAAPAESYDRLRCDCGKQFQSDIAFVGSTYQEERQDFFKKLENVNSYVSGYLRAIMNVQKEVYGDFVLERLLTKNIVKELQRVCPIERGEDEWETEAWIYANYFLARKVTGEQREEILKMLAKEFQVCLYTSDKDIQFEGVENRGPVDYISEMPYVFKNTKINLNMTLRSIHSGIPLRAMDIMGCGGFLLTNYQEDFLDYFEPGLDYIYYTDNEDLLYKTDYFLRNDEEREMIAMNGYKKVKENHTYANRIEVILTHMKER